MVIVKSPIGQNPLLNARTCQYCERPRVNLPLSTRLQFKPARFGRGRLAKLVTAYYAITVYSILKLPPLVPPFGCRARYRSIV